jgi:protein-S-isoprenylcysteine O-methyltransferase Ste14
MQYWRHLRSILLLPVTVTLLIPGLILLRPHSIHIGWGLPSAWQLILLSGGLLCLAAGLRLLVQTIALFATQGHGTLAPWDPPRRLVVRGVYRHVRNPMISGVILILVGESLLLGSGALAAWCVLVTLVNMLYIPLLEEPALKARFGAAYQTYKQHVPRWIPRHDAWDADRDVEALERHSDPFRLYKLPILRQFHKIRKKK